MKWFKRRRNEPEFEIISKDIPVSHLTRWFLYDTGLIDPNEVVHLLNLTPVSDEGDDKESEDSDIRIGNIIDMIPFLELMSDITAEVITAIQVKEIMEMDEGEDKIEQQMEVMKSLYKVIGLSALVSSFSSAVELGLINKDLINDMRMVDGEKYEQLMVGK